MAEHIDTPPYHLYCDTCGCHFEDCIEMHKEMLRQGLKMRPPPPI